MKKVVAGILIVAFALVQPSSTGAQDRRYGGDGARPTRSHAERGRGRRRRYRGGRWEWYQDPVTTGLIGGLLGGWLAGQREQATRPGREGEDVEDDGPEEAELKPWSSGWLAYCKRKYKSFSTTDGRYLAYDGNRYFCEPK